MSTKHIFPYLGFIKNLIYIILFLIASNGVAQEFADKEYYLVDSLDLDALTESDKEIIETSLKEYHKAKDDTSKVHAIEFLIEECWDDDVCVIGVRV